MRVPLRVAVVAFALAAGAQAQEPTTAVGYLKRGDQHFAKFDYDKAIADFTKAIELDKKFVQARRQRAKAFGKNGEHEKAAADYTAVIEAGSPETGDFLERGLQYRWVAGKNDEAIADFTRVIQKEPKNTRAYEARAFVFCHGQKKFDKALADYDSLIDLDPTAYNYDLRARCHHARGDLKAAIADYTAVIGLEPQQARHYSDRALVYAQAKELDNAIADCDTAVRLEPKEKYHYLWRAAIFLEQKDRLDAAIAECTKVLTPKLWDAESRLSDPGFHAHLLRGEAYRRKGAVQQATADFNGVIERSPVYAGTLYLYQRKLLPDMKVLPKVKHFDTEQVVAEATEAIEKNPKDADAHVRLGAMAGDPKKAIEHYTTALKLAPDQAAALHVCRGAAYQTAGRYASAVADYREALQLDPKFDLAEMLMKSAVAKMTEYKTSTTLESVRLDEEVFFVTTAVERITYPKDKKKVLRKSLTTRHEVTVADVRRADVETRAAIRQKQESSSGSSSSTTTSDSTQVGGGVSVGPSFLSFSARGSQTWGSGSENGYTSTTLTGWESEFGTTIRAGMEKSRAWTSSVETTEQVEIEIIGEGDDQPLLVLYQDKYRTGTAKLKINGVVDEVRFAFPVGKDMTWKPAPKAKPEEKK